MPAEALPFRDSAEPLDVAPRAAAELASAPHPPDTQYRNAVLEELRTIRRLLAVGSPELPELLDARQTAQLLGIGEATLYRGRAAGTYPAPVRLPGSATLVRWRRADLMHFIAKLKTAK